MGTLMDPINRRAMDMGVPLSVHIDPTWRCNERCIHCYLDHGEADELSLSELRELLDQMADAGTLFLTLSGGEIFCAGICSRSSSMRAFADSISSSRRTPYRLVKRRRRVLPNWACIRCSSACTRTFPKYTPRSPKCPALSRE